MSDCLVGGSARNHRGRVIEVMVGPDLPTLADHDLLPEQPVHVTPWRPIPEPNGGGARAFTCEGHVETVRAFLERHYQPRRMAYRDGRPTGWRNGQRSA